MSICLCNNILKTDNQGGQIFNDGFPENVEINSEISMNETIPHADDFLPWDFWTITFYFLEIH